MRSRLTLVAVLLIALPLPAQTTGGRDTELARQIEALVTASVNDNGLPGMIAAIADDAGVIASGSAGVRRINFADAFTVDDRVHIGSCTKAMTCVLLATLVQDETLSWETTILDVFPELEGLIRTEYETVTLWDLVTHRSGLPANAENWWALSDRPLLKRRRLLLQENLSREPAGKHGDFLYSNLGYMVAGCMAETKTGATWEALLRKRVFTPLKMTSAGFGPPGDIKTNDEPWGHRRGPNKKWMSLHADNAEALGPAGRVHCSIADWAKFGRLWLSEKRPLSLSDDTFAKLTEPVGYYAAGWGVNKRPWAKGLTLNHSGSNTMWYCTAWVAPGNNRVYLVATNSSEQTSHATCDKIIAGLIKLDTASDQ